MNIIGSVVAGNTDRIKLPLLENGAAFDATGFTVTEILIRGNDGTVVDTSGDIGWDDQDASVAYYDPDADDFDAGNAPYSVRITLTDGASKTRSYPRGALAYLQVRNP
jgi:hypothetical protein